MDIDDEQASAGTDETAKPKRKRNRATTASPRRLSRIERRAEAAKKTLREIIRLRKPDLDVDGLSFLEVVDRDADAWGRFVAQLAEWVVPFGRVVDLVFGAPLLTLVGLAPSVRAARRDLHGRREQKRAERKAQTDTGEPVYDEQGNLVTPET